MNGVSESKKFVDYECERMLGKLHELSTKRREAEVLKKQIKDYEKSQSLRRGWIEQGIDCEHHLKWEIEEFEKKLKELRRDLNQNRNCQANTRHFMVSLELYRATMLPQGKLVERTQPWCKALCRYYEEQYLKYRKMQRPTRVQPRRGDGLIKRYF
jgi:hypothetical protein